MEETTSSALSLARRRNSFFAVFKVEVLCGKQIVNDGGSRLAESIRKNGAKSDVGDSKGILEPHLLAGALIDELVAVTEKFPEFTDFLHRDITGRDDVELKKVGNPHSILVVRFLPLNSPDVFKVCDNDMEMCFEHIKNGDPVFASGFHADLSVAMTQKPVTAGDEVRVESGEPLFL